MHEIANKNLFRVFPLFWFYFCIRVKEIWNIHFFNVEQYFLIHTTFLMPWGATKYFAVQKTRLLVIFEVIKPVLIGTAFVELCWFTFWGKHKHVQLSVHWESGKKIIKVSESLFLFIYVELEVWRCISFSLRNFIVVWLRYLFHVVEIWSERQTTCLGLTWPFARTKCRFSTSWKILRVYRTSLHGTCISVKQPSCWCDVVLLCYQLTGELDHLKWLPLSLFDLHCTLSGL